MAGSFAALRRRQLGAFSRQQANEHGVSDRTLAVRVRAGRIQRVYRGVYVDFTGPVPWETQLWAACWRTAPRPLRVTRDAATIYRDAEYEDYGLIVELDGRTGHADTASRWRDMTRDNAAATEAKWTLRFGYQIVADPCAAAAQVAAVLHLQGWLGSPVRCGPACSVPGLDPALGRAANLN